MLRLVTWSLVLTIHRLELEKLDMPSVDEMSFLMLMAAWVGRPVGNW